MMVQPLEAAGWHIITGGTVDRAPLLSGDEPRGDGPRTNGPKAIVREALRELVTELDVTLRAWVILDNHYHLLLRARPDGISHLIGRLHERTAGEINRLHHAADRPVWRTHWDRVVRNETELNVAFNYLHHNTVKHRYVQLVDEWPHSSYHYYLRTRGQTWLNDHWFSYPMMDLTGADRDW